MLRDRSALEPGVGVGRQAGFGSLRAAVNVMLQPGNVYMRDLRKSSHGEGASGHSIPSRPARQQRVYLYRLIV
jgi:hypothetical protein